MGDRTNRKRRVNTVRNPAKMSKRWEIGDQSKEANEDFVFIAFRIAIIVVEGYKSKINKFYSLLRSAAVSRAFAKVVTLRLRTFS